MLSSRNPAAVKHSCDLFHCIACARDAVDDIVDGSPIFLASSETCSHSSFCKLMIVEVTVRTAS